MVVERQMMEDEMTFAAIRVEMAANAGQAGGHHPAGRADSLERCDGCMNVYTRTGDDGTTGLFYGGRVSKDSARPAAYGDVDEAQSALGLARAHGAPDGAGAELDAILLGVQRDLWVLMAELATGDDNQHKLVDGATRVTADMVAALEATIDDITRRFDPPTEFVVPGASITSAALDLARTVVRRAERSALVVGGDSNVVPYLNRLSDLVWTLARWQEGPHQLARDVATPTDFPEETP